LLIRAKEERHEWLMASNLLNVYYLSLSAIIGVFRLLSGDRIFPENYSNNLCFFSLAAAVNGLTWDVERRKKEALKLYLRIKNILVFTA